MRERRVRIFRPSSNQAVPAKPKLVDLHGAGGDGAGEKQCWRCSSCPSHSTCRKSCHQRISTPATKKICRRNSRHHRRRYRGRHRRRRHRRRHSRGYGHRRGHRQRCRRCYRRCHRRRWFYPCYHCTCKPAVQLGLCLNLWLLCFVLQEKRK